MEGAKIARDIHRKMTSDQDNAAKEILTKNGMQVTELSAAEVEPFRKLAQPAVTEFVAKEVGKASVDKLFAEIKKQKR